MNDKTLKPGEIVNELVCESCGQSFHYDLRRHCWKCDALTCPQCGSEENVCPECRARVIPDAIEPMLAKTGAAKERKGWSYEFKWDGMRVVSYWNGTDLRLQSRNLIDTTFRYPELKGLGGQLGDNAIVDGEIIALDDEGKPSFSILQKRMKISAARARRSLPRMEIRYFIFDILFLNGRELMSEPYLKRREILESLDMKHPYCQVPPSHSGNIQPGLAVAKKFALEGLICKKNDSVYVPGLRSSDWLKVKLVKSREFIIGGFVLRENEPGKIASLQLGAYDDNMQLQYVGSVGTGFAAWDHELLCETLTPDIIKKSAFDSEVDKEPIFVKPVHIAQVEYRRWPRGGSVHQASFKGLRTDKHPSRIKMEEP
jgi:bifunctional non-homologous end joining protein LigD